MFISGTVCLCRVHGRTWADTSCKVWHGSQEKYQRYDQIGGRFNSEFGLAAFPHIDTIKSFVIENAEMFPQSRTMDFHNKADGHDRRIATYLIENFRISRDLEVSTHSGVVWEKRLIIF